MALSLLPVNLPIRQVGFIAYTNFDCFWCLMLLKHMVPDFKIFERSFVRHIIDHYCTISILHVVWNKTSESLLSSSVPELYSVVLPVTSNVFYMKVNSYSRLHVEKCTLSPS